MVPSQIKISQVCTLGGLHWGEWAAILRRVTAVSLMSTNVRTVWAHTKPEESSQARWKRMIWEGMC